ncbi:nutritionally-regulated adipose and cardiac-enriched [Rhinolophus ferrumequinum]|uniref:Nutritionally-regulated adipose and cardiac-enriched n=1 Tax=Rhinolophus ferrumequinum TaxID=59479 RepID=A0A7J7XND8_RHIFE|nr:nutritionally-regulated adipose and cardiac-enriched [Rhinolophus ferrumequinum]
MRTVAQALSPSSRPEAGHQARRDETATPGSPTPRTGREGNRECPPSILRLSRPEHCGHGAEPQRTSRHVRFHEPLEVAVHYIAGREPTAIAKAVCVRPAVAGAGAVLWPRGPPGPAPRPGPAPTTRSPRLLALPPTALMGTRAQEPRLQPCGPLAGRAARASPGWV